MTHQSRALLPGRRTRALLLAFATLVGARPTGAQIIVRAENSTGLERPDETLSLEWATVRRLLPAAGPDRVRVLDATTRAELLSQALDGDGDGAVDSLLFVAAFRPHEVRRFVVEPRAPADVEPRVFAMHEDDRDDVAWESDRMAYRTYGQGLWRIESLESSGIDVWMKRVPDLVVRRWYEAGGDSYHIDTGAGADFFSVGASLGAGGTAVWRDGRMHRALNFADHRILANGPVRVVLELSYAPRDAAGVEVSEVKRIAMDAGQHLFRSESRFSGPDGPIQVVAGTVKRQGLVGTTRRNGAWAWLSTWGPVDRSAGGHGRLGTGLVIPDSSLVETRETGDHYLVLTTARPGAPVVFYTGAGWTASGDLDTAEDWWDHLDAFVERLANPVRLTVEETP